MAGQLRHIGVRLEGERDEAVRHLAFRPGPSLRDILNSSTARVRSACAGLGGCGLCRVRIDAGDAGTPTTAEVLHLGEERLAVKERLSCQVIPCDDMDVTVLAPAQASAWRTSQYLPYEPAYRLSTTGRGNKLPLAVAVDLGTTQISIAVCDVASGRRLGVRSGPNPQARLGADVIGRLDAARSELAAQELRRLAVDAIGSALTELFREEGLVLADVGRVCVVGNSAMLTLLSGRPPDALLDPSTWTRPLDCPVQDQGDLAAAWNLCPAVTLELLQPLGGFVGSDLLSGVIHSRLMERATPALLIDFGTNSEIGLWDGSHLWVTAAAGGPAFEATGIGCGMGAEPGAIHRLSRTDDGLWMGEVLESRPPRGICGSGLVDLLAILRSGGEVDERGRLQRQPLTVALDGAEFAVSKADIDLLQRAKAAMATGVEVLCRRAGISFDQLGAVYVAGTFGEHLDVENAERIGLLPPVSTERVVLAGNTALFGALDLSLSDEAEAALGRARREVTLVNLSFEQEFEDLFLDHLYIRPMVARPCA